MIRNRTSIGIGVILGFFVLFEGKISAEFGILVFSLGTALLVLLHRFSEKKIAWHPFFLIYGIFVLSAGTSSLFSINRFVSSLEFLRILSLFFLTCLSWKEVREHHQMDLVYGFIIITFIAVLPSLFIYLKTYGLVGSSQRLIGSFKWYNHMANFILLTFPLVFYVAFTTKNKLVKYFLLTGSVALGIAFIFTYSRAAWLAAGMGMVILFLSLIKKYGKKDILIRIIIIFLIGFVIFISNTSVGQRMRSIPKEFFAESRTTSGNVRVDAYQVAIDIFHDYPLFGSGIGTYGIVYGHYQHSAWLYARNTHNIFLQVLAEQGIFGIFAFILLVSMIVLIVIQSKRPLFPLDLALIIALSMAFFHNFFDTSLTQLSLSGLFWVEVGMLLGLREKESFWRVPKNNSKGIKQSGWCFFSVLATIAFVFFLIVSFFFTFRALRYRQAKIQAKKYNFNDAIKIILPMAQTFPYNDKYLQLLGSIYWLKGNTNEAVNYYRQAVMVNPWSVGNYQRLAEVLANIDQDKNAIHVLEKAISQKPFALIRTYIALSQLYLRNNEITKAEDILKTAIYNRFPLNTAYYDRLRDYQFVGIDKDLAQAYKLLAQSLIRNGKIEQSKEITAKIKKSFSYLSATDSSNLR